MHLRRIRLVVTLISLSTLLLACGGGSATPERLSLPPLSSAPPASLTPTASPSPSVDPLMQPRMDGRYEVVKRATDVHNVAGIRVGDVLRRTYRISPSCPIGPCGGPIRINLDETSVTITRTLAYDETTHTYSLVPIPNPVICSGVDGRQYRLTHTTDTVTITPVSSAPTLVDVIVTKWTAEEELKAVPDGPALDKGHCKTAVVKYHYTGTLEVKPS